MILTYPVEEMGKEVAEQALDEYLINGKSLRKWISILSDELTILEKIRAEIADLDDADYDYEGYYKAVNDALQIIDKYKAEGEENIMKYDESYMIDRETRYADEIGIAAYKQGKRDMAKQLRAEIEQKCCITVGRENDPAISLYDVFEIIDKYREGKE